MSDVKKDPQSTKVVTGEVRLSFVVVDEPKLALDGKSEKYSAQLLIDKKDTETLKWIDKAMENAKNSDKGKEKLMKNGKWKPNLRSPLRDGDDPKEQKQDDPTYQGKYFINVSAAADKKPGLRKLVDGALCPVEKGEIYSGCYGKASINAFPYDTAGNAGIAFGLNNLMKTRDGDPLSGRSSAEADFADEVKESAGGDESWM